MLILNSSGVTPHQAYEQTHCHLSRVTRTPARNTSGTPWLPPMPKQPYRQVTRCVSSPSPSWTSPVTQLRRLLPAATTADYPAVPGGYSMDRTPSAGLPLALRRPQPQEPGAERTQICGIKPSRESLVGMEEGSTRPAGAGWIKWRSGAEPAVKRLPS